MRNTKLALGAIVAVVAAFAVVLAVGTSPGHAKSNAAFKAAWVYVGPHNDGGWSQAHDVGRQYVQKALGSKVQTTYKESVPEGPQTCQVIDQLVRDGNKIIFGTSYGFQPCMLSEAKKYPDVKFEMATGDQQLPNLADYYGAGEDAIYLSGIAAGAATKTGVVGYVVPFAIPEVIRHTNAFALGVQTSHPGAKIKIIWTNSWFAPDKEKKAAENLKAAGADVIGQNVDDPAIGQYDETQGIPWVGYDSNAMKFAKKSWLTAAVYNWGPYYLSEVKKAMNGTWKTQFWYGSLKSGFAQLAPYGKGVSAATKKLIAQKRALIESGKWNEFQGPIYDQSGKLRVKKGQRLTVKDLYAINWLVKGVIGSPKG
ncbi:MAG TPA: BMP family ABC transporter substrate-binding protein [Gaiellaceae bacterium]|nr:BMP family ABC transporter substrate-binding protein [Gaiellaceae bacterium]